MPAERKLIKDFEWFQEDEIKQINEVLANIKTDGFTTIVVDSLGENQAIQPDSKFIELRAKRVLLSWGLVCGQEITVYEDGTFAKGW